MKGGFQIAAGFETYCEEGRRVDAVDRHLATPNESGGAFPLGISDITHYAKGPHVQNRPLPTVELLFSLRMRIRRGGQADADFALFKIGRRDRSSYRIRQ